MTPSAKKTAASPPQKGETALKKYLITGCAGFIGSNFVYYMLKKYDEILLVNLDKLTYAGNLENLKGVEGDSRHVFVQGDICDRALVEKLFLQYDFDCVINFAAESHVDRSISSAPRMHGKRTASGHLGKNMCRFPPTKCTAALAPRAISPKRRPCARTARTLLPKPAQICSSWRSTTLTACR